MACFGDEIARDGEECVEPEWRRLATGSSTPSAGVARRFLDPDGAGVLAEGRVAIVQLAEAAAPEIWAGPVA
jgi:hypothetical protein